MTNQTKVRHSVTDGRGVGGTARSAEVACRRARRDLRAALDVLMEQGRMLTAARYDRRNRGAVVKRARRLRAADVDVVTMAVLFERAAGATWAEMAEALNLDERFVVEHYEPLERQWLTGNGIGPIMHGTEGQALRLQRST